MRRIYLQKAKTEVARSNTIRNINRQIGLNYVREREPISRAEIAKQTELQRSTVSAIVDSLVTEGFIKEIGVGESSGGRKPTLLQLRKDQPVAVGVDITPTTTSVALANLAGEILEQQSFQTSPDSEKTFEQIIKRLLKIKSKLKSDSVEIGVSVPGLVDAATGIVSYVPYFQWKHWNLKQKIERAAELPVVIDNDANAIALAELWFGGLEHTVKNFVSVLVAEGIGTGIIFDGQIYRGNQGAAGEFGHMVVGSKNKVVCSCGSTQCWEAFASNKATLARFNDLTARKAENIEEVFSLALEQNAEALRIVNETTRFLALGIVNLIVGLSPEIIVISGKITRIWSLIERQLLETVETNIRQKLPEIQIKASTLGEQPTLQGAISLSLIHKFASAT
ncbi:MAG TPA: ROK family transcriptional regulator [Pyrinomonadaceae bacterium]|nr:ROK family transcriptional regulator [Pyrinomonadaceae bacterium]